MTEFCVTCGEEGGDSVLKFLPVSRIWICIDPIGCTRRFRMKGRAPVEPPINAEATGNALHPITEADIGRPEFCATCYGQGYREGIEAAAKHIDDLTFSDVEETYGNYERSTDGPKTMANIVTEIRSLVDSEGLSKEPKR